MNLKQRLQALRTQGGGTSAAADGPDLRTRLQRARPGRAAACRRLGDEELAARLGGRVTAEGLITIAQRVALPPDQRAAGGVGGLPDAPVAAPGGWVYMDTETTGLAGGSGTLVFLVGLARLQGGVLQLRQFLATRFAGEAAMLAQGGAWLGGAGLISYNGKTFDAPLLSTRCRMARQPDWVGGRPHLDLLYAVRRAFAPRWPDCRLGTVERNLLGVRRDQDLPGAAAPQAWLAHLQAGDARLLPAVLRHNAQDLASLALLVPRLAAVYECPEHHDADATAVARAWLRRGQEARALAILERNRAVLPPAGLHELGRMLRRAGCWQQAGAVWRDLAANGDAEAIAHLVRYEEHVRRDPFAATRWALQLPAHQARDRRLQRLADKQARRSRTLALD